jgi:hypothetical protein
MRETIERVLFNPRNGELAVGIRLRFMDKYERQDMGPGFGYTISCEPRDHDAWGIQDHGTGWWVVVTADLASFLEDLGPL